MVRKLLLLCLLLATISVRSQQLKAKVDSLQEEIGAAFERGQVSRKIEDGKVFYYLYVNLYEQTTDTLYTAEDGHLRPYSESETQSIRNRWKHSEMRYKRLIQFLNEVSPLAVEEHRWEIHSGGADSIMWSMTFPEGEETLRFDFSTTHIAKQHPEFRHLIPKATGMFVFTCKETKEDRENFVNYINKHRAKKDE